MALPVNGSTHLIPAYYSFYRPRKDERLSWPHSEIRIAINDESQGSVAICLKRGRIFKHEFVANLLHSRLVKKF